MCGLNGILFKNEINISDIEFSKSLNHIQRRGPDNTSFKSYIFPKNKIYFGHTRLSIQDLDSKANQPFTSSNKRFACIWNGEIYNFLTLKKFLIQKGFKSFKSTSDTEVLVELLNYFSFEELLERLEGMFSIAVLDNFEKKLFLARDRAGEKPMYISIRDGLIGFGSDLSSIYQNQYLKKEIDSNALGFYFKLNYIPFPYTIYKNTFKLEPGSMISFCLDNIQLTKCDEFEELKSLEGIEFKKWWQPDKNEPKKYLDTSNTQSQFESLLESVVSDQLISDRPVGAFLSGGIDSSLITAMMQKLSGNINTYTIGFDFNDFDESIYAEEVAAILGTSHKSHICSKADVLSIIPHISDAYTEPFADSSQVPTMLVSKIAKNDITVALTGDGGDELFGGYNRYIIAQKYWKIIEKIPFSLKKFFSSTLIGGKDFPPIKLFANIIFSNIKSASNSNRIEKIGRKILNTQDEFSYYNSMITQWESRQLLNVEHINPDKVFEEKFELINDSLLRKMMMLDFNTYLPDDILCKVDRASMHYSLETRAPFLNHRIIEFTSKLPDKLLIHNGKGKVLLREALNKFIPKKVFDRPKQGFGIPIGEWLKSDLREWSEHLLSSSVCNEHGLFNQDLIDQSWNNHKNSLEDNTHKLWSILVFNQWYEKNF